MTNIPKSERSWIDLSSLTAHGKAHTKLADNALDIWTERSNTSVAYRFDADKIRQHCVSFPNKYRLPLRLDMTIKHNYPPFWLLIEGGYISFGSLRDSHKIEDIAFPSGKSNQDFHAFDNSIPLSKWIDISITFNLDEMQILIGGEERFYSRKLAYMSKRKHAELATINDDGLSMDFMLSKLSVLSVKSIVVTEFEEFAPIMRGAFEDGQRITKPESGKPTFESVIANLPIEYQDEIAETDIFLKNLMPLKFNRSIDKNGGKTTWVASDYGVSWQIEPDGNYTRHSFWWYIVTGGKPEAWHRKADYMEETLSEIAKSDPQLAGRIFYAINDCVDCGYGSGCLGKTLYKCDGEKRLSCHGKVVLRMCHEDFNDVREFFRHLNDLVAKKNGALPEKIYLIK